MTTLHLIAIIFLAVLISELAGVLLTLLRIKFKFIDNLLKSIKLKTVIIASIFFLAGLLAGNSQSYTFNKMKVDDQAINPRYGEIEISDDTIHIGYQIAFTKQKMSKTLIIESFKVEENGNTTYVIKSQGDLHYRARKECLKRRDYLILTIKDDWEVRPITIYYILKDRSINTKKSKIYGRKR